VAFQSFVVLVFIWLGDGSRLNKSCLHDLGVPYHHCYRVSSPLLVEFISAIIEEFDEWAPRVWVVLNGQGRTDMVKDHRLAAEAIVWEFYVNLHQRLDD
jgi:hypothetical protein